MKSKIVLKKRLYAMIAFVAVTALLITGTYAFKDYSQHKSNELMNKDGSYLHDVMLIEDFDPKEDWSTTDYALKKEIRVANIGTSEFGGLFVRIQLKEYMEIAEVSYEYSEYRYAVSADGKYVTFSSPAAAIGTPYEEYTVEKVYNAVLDREDYYVRSGDNQIGGQYGKHIITKIDVGELESLVEGVERADTEAEGSEHHEDGTNGECEYTVHSFKEALEDCGYGFHDYVKWYLGEDVIALSDWLEAGGTLDKKWVYDDTQEDGWVYWVEELAPGQTTTNLLEQVELINQPNGEFYYVIHVDMQAVSKDELAGAAPEWSDAPIALIEKLTGKIVTTTVPSTT